VAYIATNANVTSESVFDFTRFNKIDSGNILLSAADRITAYYDPAIGRPGKDLEQLMFGVGYPGNKVQGKTFDSNSFTLTSNIIGFNYTGMKITSANIQAVDFVKSGFGLDDTLIDAIAERSPYKFGLKTIGTNIPIISEEEMRKINPDYMLVLPWHFISEFISRENEYLTNGGKFIVPCPQFEIIGK
jgi:hypothetical protein